MIGIPLPEQRKFIERSPSQHALMAAGPGTGKTFVLDRRSEFLVHAGVDSDRIALVTLTRAMAQSLSDRVAYGSASTLHAFALHYLNNSGGAWNKVVASSWEETTIIARDLQLVYKLTYGDAVRLNDVKKFLSRLSEGFSNNQTEPPDLSPLELRLLHVFRHCQQLLDFALLKELVFDLNQLLEAGVHIVNAPTHVLVDEYQDLTAGELRLLQLLSQTHGVTVSACGDDRQSIYGFRSADPLGLHRFAEIYELEEVDSLHRSSRLPDKVCQLANAIAELLPPIPGLHRPPLQPWEGREDVGVIHAEQFKSVKAECEAVGKYIAELLSAGRTPDQIMVIAATCHDAVLRALQKYAAPIAGIDFVNARKPDSPKSTEEILVRAVRLLREQRSRQLGVRLLVHLCPGFSDAKLSSTLESPGAKYVDQLNYFADRDMVGARVRDTYQYIEAELGSTGVDIGEIAIEAAKRLRKVIDPIKVRKLTDQSDEESLPDDEENPLPDDPTTIAVHTIHSSKGLEQKVVFLVTAVEQAFSGRTDPADGLRQLFVAVTRTSEELYISAPGYIGRTELAGKLGVSNVNLAEVIVHSKNKVR